MTETTSNFSAESAGSRSDDTKRSEDKSAFGFNPLDADKEKEENAVPEKEEKGFFMKFLTKIWQVKDSNKKQDEQNKIRQTFKELIIYIVFLIFVALSVSGSASTTQYYYTRVMKNLFVEGETDDGPAFQDIKTVADFWDYSTGVLVQGLYWDKWYNGDPLPPDQKYIYYENLLLGPPRIRQIRVEENSCEINEAFKNFFNNCYAEFTSQNEDKEQMIYRTTAAKANDSGPDLKQAYQWRSQSQLNGYETYGQLTKYYGGGFAIDLSNDAEQTKAILEGLKKQLWINRGTRAVFMHFTLYNANINLFSVVTLLVEFPATGGAIPRAILETVKLLRYATTYDMFVLGCECVFLLFIFYYLVEEVIEIMHVGWRYFLNFWNIIDVLLILIAIACTVFNLTRNFMIKDRLKGMKEKLNTKGEITEYQNFELLAFLEGSFKIALALLVFFAVVKVFKYISFNKTMTQLSTTLRRCAKDLVGFITMFTIVFMAFTQLGYLLFGRKVEDFSTLLDAFFTLFRIILGDFDFAQLEKAHRLLGPVYFILFVFFVFFVLINMFLAIINDTYSEVKSDMAKSADVFIMSDYIKMGYNKFMTKLASTREKVEALEKMVGGGQTTLSYDEFKVECKAQGYEDQEIEMVFTKYDTDGDRMLDPGEQRLMLHELAQQKEAMTKQKMADDAAEEDEDAHAHKEVPPDQFMTLQRRVDRMEATVTVVLKNIDNVLTYIKG